MDTPETVVWVVTVRKDPYSRWDDGMKDELLVNDVGFLDKAYAEKRRKHLAEEYGLCYAEIYPVKVAIPPAAPEYIPMPYPVMPSVPSMIYTPDTGLPMQVAYDAPRRVFRQPGPSLGDVVSSTWDAWASQQAAKGNFEEAAATRPAIEQLFEESPEGRLQLFPRDLPAPVH